MGMCPSMPIIVHNQESVDLTDNRLWGGRFNEKPASDMRLLNDSIQFDQILYDVDIQGSMAYAAALANASVLTAEEATPIQQGLEQIRDEFEAGTFAFRETDEDIHTAVERRLTEIIGPVGGKLHTGRSRNDQVATDIRLWLREACDGVGRLVSAMQEALVEQAEAHTGTIMPGYTHVQPAQPITAGHWLMSFFWMLQRDRERLRDCQRRINVSPLGASALAGTPYPVDVKALAQSLGFDGVTPNSLDAVSDRDGIAEYLFVCSLIGVHLSRLAEDVILFSNPAFGFITLPDAYSTGSSLMPQKRNADPMELARGKAGRFIGNLNTILAALKGLPSGYNKDLQEDKEPLFDTTLQLQRLLPVIAELVRTMMLNPDRMRSALEMSMLATELADWLVIEKGVPFREAHHLAGEVVRAAEEAGVAIDQLPLAVYQKISSLFDDSLYAVLDFEQAVAKRNSPGGTSFASVKRQIQQAHELLNSSA